VHTNLLRELSSSSEVLSLIDLCWQQQLAVGSLRLLQQSEDPWPSPPSQHLGRSSSSPEQLTPRIPSISLCWQPATGAVFSTPRPSFRACASAPLLASQLLLKPSRGRRHRHRHHRRLQYHVDIWEFLELSL